MSSSKLPSRRRFIRNLLGLSGVAGVVASSTADASKPRAVCVNEAEMPVKLKSESRSLNFEGNV